MGNRPVVFGEILMDVFPDGQAIPGGAPFNVACHLAAFGADPLFISAVGNDDHGRQLLQLMESNRMDISGIQISDTHPTGTVAVAIRNNEPEYTIQTEVAWDFIEPSHQLLEQATSSGNILVFGTLAQRSVVSRNSLQRLLADSSMLSLVDLNLRQPFIAEEVIKDSLKRASFVKLNRAELGRVTGHVSRSEHDLIQDARELVNRYRSDALWVTCGEEGSWYIGKNGDVEHYHETRNENIADTVGAGDAYTAVLVLAYINGWNTGITLKRAHRFAAAICSVRGALPADHEFYSPWIREWK